MNKRISAALLTAALSLALVLPVSALSPAPVSEAEAVQAVNALGIMVGDQNGNMNLDAPVTRAEFTTMVVKATPNGDQVGQASTSPYPDVTRNHWASGYVEAAVHAGLISGYTDGTFRPNNRITLAEGAAITLRLLGYGPADFSGAYPTGQLAMYHSLQLDQGLSAAGARDQLTRRDAMYLFYNLMTAQTKAGPVYLTTLGHSLNAAGEIDLVALVNSSMEGPIIADSGWTGRLPFDPAGAKVYRNGRTSTLSGIMAYDVVYWNAGMKTLWAYSDKVTGAIQAVSPSSSKPSSVTVAGRTCPIETSSAAYALSDLGSYRVGDSVTLLLGRGGGVAGVAAPSAADRELVGLVTNISDASYSDGNGGSYQARTVTVLASDGQSYSYPVEDGGREDRLVRVTVREDGSVSLNNISDRSLTGWVSGDGSQVGSLPFAKDAEILDVSKKQGLRVYPARLAGTHLSGDMVRWYSTNSAGEIDRMLLDDVTGDLHQYGVLTEMRDGGNGIGSMYSYQMDLNGVPAVIPQSGTRFPVEKGPIQVKGPVQNPDLIRSLTSAGRGDVSGTRFLAGSQTYTLSDTVVVYEHQGSAYRLSSLSRVQGQDLTLVGWYDKTDDQGGRIRVITAEEY